MIKELSADRLTLLTSVGRVLAWNANLHGVWVELKIIIKQLYYIMYTLKKKYSSYFSDMDG